MLTPDFAFHQTATVRRWLRRDISEDVYSAPETVRCRVHFKTRKTYGKDSETVAVGSVWFPAGTPLKAGDRVGIGGMEYNVISAHPSYDFAGKENHIEAEIQ